jgi:hypothetical protein
MCLTHSDERRKRLLSVQFAVKEAVSLVGTRRKRADVVTFRPAVKVKYTVIVPTPQMDAEIVS